jgi:hypothetical protein
MQPKSDRDPFVMPSGIPSAEDYINNAKLTANTQRSLKRIKLIAVLAVVVVSVLIYALDR